MESEGSLKSLNAVGHQDKVTGNKKTAVVQPLHPARADPQLADGKVSGVLQRLGLRRYFPQKLEVKDILLLKDFAVNGNVPSDEKDLAVYILQRLLTLDWRAMNFFLKVNESDRIPDTAVDSNDDFLSLDIPDEDDTQSEHIHPKDVFMAIFLCSDNFLRQYISTKLSTCHLAVPLLVRESMEKVSFVLWSLRSIIKSWKMADSGVTYEQAIVDAETNIISFLRIGGCESFSKSNLLNLLISQKHETFFTRESEGSSKSRHLVGGLAEISWFLPSGKKSDPFKQVMSFVNLRGDACESEEQVEFLLKVSSIMVAIVSDDGLKNGKVVLQRLVDAKIPLVLICTDNKQPEVTQKTGNVKIGIKGKSVTDVKNWLSTIISNSVRNKPMVTLSNCAEHAHKCGFIIDEQTTHCEQGKGHAEMLMAFLGKEELSNIKSKFLSLQGELWHQWCQLEKEEWSFKEYSSDTSDSMEQYTSKLRTQRNNIRQRQLQGAFPLNDFIAIFIQTMSQHNQNEIGKYFMHWLKCYLDHKSAETLPSLHAAYYAQWSKICEIKKKKVPTATLR